MYKLTEKLKEQRTKQKLDRKQCALLLGLEPDTYRKYERGTRQPDLETLIKIAEFYKISTDYILGRYN